MHRDRSYLDWLRSQPCFITGSMGEVDPAHTGTGGMGLKADDSKCIPLRHSLHQESHQVGWHSFWMRELNDNPQLLKELLVAMGEQYYREYLENQ